MPIEFSPRLPIETLPQEAQPELTPRQQLELILKDAHAGDANIRAFANTSAFREIEARIKIAPAGSEKRADLKSQLSAIRETIRQEDFGADAAVYLKAREKADRLIDGCYSEKALEFRQKTGNEPNVYEIYSSSAEEILQSVYEINLQKSRARKPLGGRSI